MNRGTKNSNAILLLLAIFTISINLRPAITSIGPMLEIIREELDLSNTQVSLLTAIPVISMGVFAVLSPFFNRLMGLRKTMYLMMLLIGIMTGIRFFATTYLTLLITAIFIGLAIAIIGPLLSAMIKQNFPHRAATMIGLYSFGMGLGATVSAGLTVVFFEKTNSYPFALGIWSALAVVGIFFWFLSTRETIQVKEQSLASRQAITMVQISPWKSAKAWLFLLFFGLQSAIFFSMITWLVPIATSMGMTLIQAGSLLTVMTIVQIVLNILLPLAMERYFSRKFWLFFILIVGVIALLLLATGVDVLMWLGAILMGIPLGGLFPIALLLPLDETEDAASANQWTAMMQTGGFIMGGILPLVIAFVFDQTANHYYTIIILLILFILMILITFFLKDKDSNCNNKLAT